MIPLTKSVLDLALDKFKIPCTELKPKLKDFFMQNGSNAGITLFTIKPTIGDQRSEYSGKNMSLYPDYALVK